MGKESKDHHYAPNGETTMVLHLSSRIDHKEPAHLSYTTYTAQQMYVLASMPVSMQPGIDGTLQEDC